jgi:hypothetical protein
MHVIGISGKKRSGKTALAQFLASRIEGARVVNFADELKAIAERLYGLDPREMNGDKGRMLSFGPTVREVLQKLGQSAREIWPDAWVNAWEFRVVELWRTAGRVPILAGDVRFPNEVEAIHAMGGLVIRLTRNPSATLDRHESETALDGYTEFDLVIDNAQMSAEETNGRALTWLREQGVV